MYQQPMYQQPMYQQQQPMMMQQQPMMMQQQPMMQQPMMVQQQPMMVQQSPMLVQAQPLIVAQPQTTTIVLNNLKDNCNGCRGSSQFNCPHCHTTQNSNVRFQYGSNVWICLPLVMDSCQDVVHTCPNCHKQVGFAQSSGC